MYKKDNKNFSKVFLAYERIVVNCFSASSVVALDVFAAKPPLQNSGTIVPSTSLPKKYLNDKNKEFFFFWSSSKFLI